MLSHAAVDEDMPRVEWFDDRLPSEGDVIAAVAADVSCRDELALSTVEFDSAVFSGMSRAYSCAVACCGPLL